MARTIADALNELYQNGIKGKIITWINDYKSNIITALAPTFLKTTDAANTYLTKTGKAASASYADSAGSATTATNANYATSAGTAATCTGTANYATSAGSATTATNANYATNATNATNATYSASTDISKVFYPISHESTEDFNNITTLGMHTILLKSDTPNKPPYIGRVFMAVVGRGTCIQQIVWNYAGGIMWIRGTDDTLPNWWTWQKVTLETVS